MVVLQPKSLKCSMLARVRTAPRYIFWILLRQPLSYCIWDDWQTTVPTEKTITLHHDALCCGSNPLAASSWRGRRQLADFPVSQVVWLVGPQGTFAPHRLDILPHRRSVGSPKAGCCTLSVAAQMRPYSKVQQGSSFIEFCNGLAQILARGQVVRSVRNVRGTD